MSETIGQQLKKAREARNLTFKKVTQATHIQAHLIEAMEADDFESIPSPVQARAFLRLYAEFLELSLDELIAHQRASTEAPSTILNKAVHAPSQNQESEEIPDSPTEAEPDNGPRKDTARSSFQEIITGLPHRIRRSQHRSKRDSRPEEPAAQITPSEPEETIDQHVATAGAEGEEPVQRKMEEPSPPDTISAQTQSQVIFTTIGRTLQERREALSLTFDEIEAHTHVRTHYLQALEAGDFDHLPSSVQTRGMLNNYAHFLDMDVDVILLRFAEGLQAQRLERQTTLAEKTIGSDANRTSRTILFPRVRRFFSMDVLVGAGLILFLLISAIWGTTRVIGSRSASTPQPTTLPISDVLAITTLASTAIPVPTNESGNVAVIPTVNATAIVTVPAAGQGPVQIVLVALEQAFVRVTVDGKNLFDGRVIAGTAYPFNGNSQIEILTGNGAAISILFNQSDLGPMGSIGEVVDRIYTADAILNPTATITPSPTITLTPTVTPRPSLTPLPGSASENPTATQGQG
jgi:cytoskeleton protein RodZ